jgi:hypothetical protein
MAVNVQTAFILRPVTLRQEKSHPSIFRDHTVVFTEIVQSLIPSTTAVEQKNKSNVT